MSKSSPSPPAAPDPSQTAQAQTQSNLQTAIANARLNRVNQTTPWGSINYTEGPVDANGVPTYSSNIQLSPQQQRLLEQQQGMQLQRGGIANTLLDRVGSNLSNPLDLSGLHAVNDRGSMYQGAVNRAPVQDLSTAAPNMAPVTDQSTNAGLMDQMRNFQPNPMMRQAAMQRAGLPAGMDGGMQGGMMGGGGQLTPAMIQQLLAMIQGGQQGSGMQPPAAQPQGQAQLPPDVLAALQRVFSGQRQ